MMDKAQFRMLYERFFPELCLFLGNFTSDNGFYDWPSSGSIDGTAVNGLAADQRGQARSTRTWPGAWQE